MNINSIEVKMKSEFEFRNMYRRLFSIQTENDFWKKVVCEVSLYEIEKILSGGEYPISDLEESILVSEKEWLEKYSEEFSECRPGLIDFEKIQSKYDSMMSDKIFNVPGVDIPEEFKIRYCRGCCEMWILNLCPVHHDKENVFFEEVYKIGISEYVKKIEFLYFLLKKFDR